MKQVEIKLEGEFIALCNLLKLAAVAGSAGQGKHMVAAGEVTVDGQRELRGHGHRRGHDLRDYQPAGAGDHDRHPRGGPADGPG